MVSSTYKARQLSILCESSVAVVVVSASGKLYNSSSGDDMSKIIERYEIQHADELKGLDLAEKTWNYLPHKELLELVQSKLEEPNVDNLSVDFLISLEEQLGTALSVSRSRKTELMMACVKSLQEKVGLFREGNLTGDRFNIYLLETNDHMILSKQEKLLREENQVLASQVTKTRISYASIC